MHPQDRLQNVLRHNLKIEFGNVAEVVRHLKTLEVAIVSRDVGILTNSATQKSNLDGILDKSGMSS
jgi:ribosomal protein S8